MPKADWTAPRIWPDGECFILGGGPSINDIDLSLLEGKRVIAVNNAYKLGNWDVMFYGDCRWYQRHKEALTKFTGLKVHSCNANEGCGDVKKIRKIGGNTYGINRRTDRLQWNASSGACAINLAVHFGVKRIILLGFDMQKVDGETNFHRDHAHHRGSEKDYRKFNPYPRHLVPFESIARDLKAYGVECLNATPNSALKAFPIVSPSEVLS